MTFDQQNFEGIADCGSISLGTGETKRLPDNECRLAYIVRWNATAEGDYTIETATSDIIESNDAEVYFGFNGKIVDQLFQGRRSPMLPINNTNQIVVRNPKATTIQIFFVFFR